MNTRYEVGVHIPTRECISPIEVAGYSVYCIASNIRVKDAIDWDALQIADGVGFEGNLVLGQIEAVGARQEMEHLHNGEIVDAPLSEGDYIVGVFANRHSGTSEYGIIPQEGLVTREGTLVDLIASGGILGICRSVPKHLGDNPTRVRSIGLLTHPDGKIADLKDFYSPWERELLPSAPIILSLGTAAEIGKTTASTKLIEEVRKEGVVKIAASKLAGTGRKRDVATLKRAGATVAYDFPDVGLPTTYTSPERFIPATYTLLNKINKEGQPDIIVAECGGDIIEGNIPTLLQDPNIIKHVVAIIHGSTDVLSIIGSLEMYKKFGILGRVPIYLTYPVTGNYVGVRERLKQQGIDLPIFDPMDPVETAHIVDQIRSTNHRN